MSPIILTFDIIIKHNKTVLKHNTTLIFLVNDNCIVTLLKVVEVKYFVAHRWQNVFIRIEITLLVAAKKTIWQALAQFGSSAS